MPKESLNILDWKLPGRFLTVRHKIDQRQKTTFTFVGLSYFYTQLAYPGGDSVITHWVVNTCRPNNRASDPLAVL